MSINKKLLVCTKLMVIGGVLFFSCLKKENTIEMANQLNVYEHNLELARTHTNGKKSLQYSTIALEAAEKLNDDYKIANALIELSHDYDKLGKLDLALKYNFEAIKIFEINKDKEKKAICYERIGTIYFKQGDTTLSIQYLTEALKIHRQGNNVLYIGGDLINIGEIYRLTKNYNKANACITEALKYFNSENDSQMYAYAIGNLGLTNHHIGKTDSSTMLINEATKIFEKIGDYYPIAIFVAEQAQILYSKGDYIGALNQINKSIQIAEREGFLEQKCAGYKLLSQIQKKTGQYEHALESYMVYDILNDSLTNVDLVRKMEGQRIEYEVSKRESVITNLEHTNKLRKTITIALSIGMALLILFAFILFQLSKKLKSANSLLQDNKKDLEDKNMNIHNALIEKEYLLKEIHHRVKNNLQIISSLLSLQSRQLDDVTAKYAIEDSQRRLQAISFIHQILYQSENIAFINVLEYVQQLINTIEDAFTNDTNLIKHQLDIENVCFDVDTAVPLGLIINELTINTYKYAFPNSLPGEIIITLKPHAKNEYILKFKDNGIGLPHDFNIDKDASLGFKLVKILSKQLGGQLSINSISGTQFILIFTANNYHSNEA